jgi:Cu+-exporting ATPase
MASRLKGIASSLFAFSSDVKLPLDDDLPLLGAQDSNSSSNAESAKVDLRIEGMTCGSCVEAIEGMLRDQPGIRSVKVALLAERGVIEYDPSVWDEQRIINEISDIGFDATLVPQSRTDEVTLRIYGMTCGSCVAAIENGLSSVPGVNSVAVSLTAETCKVSFERALIGPREIISNIEDFGFDAMISDEQDATQIQSLTRAKEVQEWRSRFFRAFAFTLPVFIIGMVLPRFKLTEPIVNHKLWTGMYLGDLICLFLTTPCQFWLGAKFYRSAAKSLRHGGATMDVLVVIGTSAAYTYSVLALFFAMFNSDPDYHPMVYFDTSCMLIMFVSLGRYMENKAKGKTSAALTDLMALAPSMATMYTDAPACTQEKKIATELLQVGDVVKIVPGDKIPADGTVLRGSSSVDESAVTGEPVPVLKQTGDTAIGGTVNGLGTFDMTITRAGKDTALAQIVKLVEDAQTSKAPIQTFADRVAGIFVPAVISFSFLTFVVWMIICHTMDDSDLPAMFHKHGASKLAVGLQMAISVVVVACPCALGLSTPTAIMVGTGMGAKNGILIKGGKALENAKNIKTIVLDKTGTVTVGKMDVVGLNWVPQSGQHGVKLDAEALLGRNQLTELDDFSADGKTSKKEILAMITAAEAKSEHPLAKAVSSYGKKLLGSQDIQVTTNSFESVTGAGVKATMSIPSSGTKLTLLIGSARFITQSQEGYLPHAFSSYESQETALGRTIIYVSCLGPSSSSHPIPLLAISLSDEPKQSSKQAITALQSMGIQVCMMTGDGRATALAVAKQVGIGKENVWASMSPKGKASTVTELIAQGNGGVAMVGDGINDSPALVAATVGIALSSGTSVAIEAADIVLMRSDLLDVVAALHLSRSIFSTIRRNLVWACAYNIIGIPLAMGVFLPFGFYMPPMTAAAAMASSSVSVVTSSLMLRWWRRPRSCVLDEEKVGGTGVWEGLRELVGGLIPRRERPTDGYSQLPVEMNSRSTSAV